MGRFRSLLSVVLLLTAFQAFSQSRVDTVRIDVSLRDDGSALVRERWVIDVAGGITEWYLGKENLREMEIRDLKVTDETGREYVSEGYSWDVHRTRPEKAGRCGIVPKGDGCELCWGVGSNGLHSFTASYILTNLVKSYTDKDGFNYMFLTQTDRGVEDVMLTIRKEGTILTSENSSVWGFGFHGQADVFDGAVKYWSTEPFGSSSRLIAMVAFEKGLFSPIVSYDKSFEEVKQKAFDGSDYKDTDKIDRLMANFMALMALLFFFMPVIIGVIRTVMNNKRKKALLGGKEKDVDWFRDVPVGGDLRKASNILRVFSGKQLTENQNLIAAYMMRLFYRGAFSIVPQSGGGAVFKISDSAVLPKGEDMDSTMERQLFGFFKEAAGNDSLLQKRELKRWADNNSKRLYSWQNKISDGKTLKTIQATDARQVFGLKRFLKDFTLIKDRGAVEVTLWNNYLIFASLYGIADQVYKDFKKVCPEYFTLSQTVEQLQQVTPTVFWNTIGDSSRYFNNSAANYAARRAASSGGSRWSGGGGMTSFGGGGGFSGGGFSGGR
ncbi:MAG: DUF2207 domain-containing protein [Bacteroidales bacterium]|nr:DUF2207 domain-containing protein [Bacteroidales bacterium]